MDRPIEGLIAALLTPRTTEGTLSVSELRTNAEFVRSRGASGVCVLGATGEYPSVSEPERDEVIRGARAAVGSDGLVIAGAGAFRLDDSVRFAERALDLGADAILLPPPAFFPYAPQDVEAFYLEAAQRTPGRIILYNLPAFVTPIAESSALHVFEERPNIVGVKDSSGELDLLQAARDRFGSERILIPGNDAVIGEAIDRDLCDAVVSGIAGVWPELLLEVAQSAPGSGESARALLKQVCALVSTLPTPWALRCIAEARGMSPGPQPAPASTSRASQIRELDARLQKILPAA